MKHLLNLLFSLSYLLTLGQGDVVKDASFLSQIEEATQFIEELKEDHSIPSVSVAVGHRGKLIWAEAMGLADVKNNIRATPSTKYRVGSVGKSMTALALGKLYDEGKLDLDTEVKQLMPELEAFDYPVTIRQIAGHQGGIRHYKGFEFFSKKQYASVEESLDIFIHDKLEYEPGTEYLYSTYGYVLLSRIIEIVVDTNYLDYMSDEIFAPLNMTNTVAEDAGLDESNAAKFYTSNGKREVKEVNLSNKWGGGGFLSTPTDMVAMINNSNEIIDTQTLFELATPQKLNNGEATGYGIGFRISEDQSNKRLIVHHGGRSYGARAFLLVLPAEQIVVAICTNNQGDFGLDEIYALSKLFIKK